MSRPDSHPCPLSPLISLPLPIPTPPPLSLSLSLSLPPPGYHSNVKVVAFGKAVLGMLAALQRLLGNHIVDGVASVPVGAVEATLKRFPDHVPSRDRVRWGGHN